MATIVISTTGTLGDHLPFIALAAELARRGHEIRLAVNEAFHAFAQAAGMCAMPCGRRFGPEDGRRIARAFDHWRYERSAESDERDWAAIDLAGHFRDLSAAARGADLVVGSSIQAAAPLVHDATEIPWVRVSVMPWELELAAAEARESAETGGHGGCESTLHLRLERLRRELGLPPRIAAGPMQSGRPRCRLLLASRHFSAPPQPLDAAFVQTGFVFHREAAEFVPHPALARFVQDGLPPAVLTMSSLVVEDARGFLATHVRAARAAGQRLLVIGGWSGFSMDDLPDGLRSDEVLFEPYVPHEWLFPKAGAVITHGGIGTLARALQAGRPVVVEPFGSDQVFNARRVRALGVGLALHPHRLSVEVLEYALRERLAGSVLDSARALALKLAAEDGLRDAADAIEAALSPGAGAA